MFMRLVLLLWITTASLSSQAFFETPDWVNDFTSWWSQPNIDVDSYDQFVAETRRDLESQESGESLRHERNLLRIEKHKCDLTMMEQFLAARNRMTRVIQVHKASIDRSSECYARLEDGRRLFLFSWYRHLTKRLFKTGATNDVNHYDLQVIEVRELAALMPRW